jgi:hypothetical protein
MENGMMRTEEKRGGQWINTTLNQSKAPSKTWPRSNGC